MRKHNLVLIGMMGTGKSTIGMELARRLGFAFVDSDAAVEQRHDISVKEMFVQHGEPYFRRAESEALAAIMEGSAQVVATGGGAVLAEANREVMMARGFVVALTATEETIISRVSADQSRPLLQGDLHERVRSIMESRRHAYDFADLRIETDGRSVEALAEEICRGWERINS